MKINFTQILGILIGAAALVNVSCSSTADCCAAPLRLEMEAALNRGEAVDSTYMITTVQKKEVEVLRAVDGAWALFKGVDLGKKCYKSLRVRATALGMDSERFVEIREGGADGKLLARTKVPCTYNEIDFITYPSDLIYSPKGKMDLYISFICKDESVSSFAIDWIEFQQSVARPNRSLVDFFQPMEPQGEMVSEGIWGAPNVLPRDVNNGLESGRNGNLEYCYWDGGIVKDDDGKYHLYCSRWDQSDSHDTGWKKTSKAIHAVSDDVMGPYIDKGYAAPSRLDSKGHNVYGFRLHDGRYGVVTSELTQGDILVSDNPNGPFEFLGEIKVDLNGFEKGLAFYTHPGSHGQMSNVQINPREGGGYTLICRSTAVMISEKDVLGPYKIVSGRCYEKFEDLAKNFNEDPTMWYSGGYYHIVYNHWPSKISHHFTSKDGETDWKYRGEAFNRGETKIFKYTNGIENDWRFIERPTAYVENGHVTHFIFSVIDVTKGQDGGNDNHASKIVVVPFDGVAFDEYINALYDSEE